MNSKNLKMVLNAIRNMVKKNRVAYKDYLGEETVDEVICEGVCQGKATPLIIKKNEKLQLGKMYQVAIDGVVSSWICKKGYNCIGIGPFLEYLIEHGKEPTDLTGMWIIGYVNANNTIAVVVDEPSFVGKTFVVSQSITRKKYDIKKLPVELLPDTVAFLGDVKSARESADAAWSIATNTSLALRSIPYPFYAVDDIESPLIFTKDNSKFYSMYGTNSNTFKLECNTLFMMPEDRMQVVLRIPSVSSNSIMDTYAQDVKDNNNGLFPGSWGIGNGQSGITLLGRNLEGGWCYIVNFYTRLKKIEYDDFEIKVYTSREYKMRYPAANGFYSVLSGNDVPKKASTNPSAGYNYKYSRSDHIHPAELPDATSDDNGKVLGVSNGGWGKVDAFKVVMFNATSASDNSEYGSIKNIDGSDVSAQTAFDISTNNQIRLREGNKATEVVQIEWYDSTGASSDSTDVTAVILYTVTNKYLIGTLSTST